MQNRSLSGAGRIAGALVIAISLALPASARAAWEFFGGGQTGPGRTENPRLADPNVDPNMSVIGTDAGYQATFILNFGALATWERSKLMGIYSPYGEVYSGGNSSRMTHMGYLTYDHRLGRHTTFRLSDSFFYAPKLSYDPSRIRDINLPLAPNASTANDAGAGLGFRTTAHTTFALSYVDQRRNFQGGRFEDSAFQAMGTEFRSRLSPSNAMEFGYQYGIYNFRGGDPSLLLSGPVGPGPGPGPGDPNQPSDPNLPVDPNGFFDPNNILGDPNSTQDPNSGGGGGKKGGGKGNESVAIAAAAGFMQGDAGSARHRAWLGYTFGRRRGFHLDLQGGADLLVFDDPTIEQESAPYVDSSVGWNGKYVSTRIGYVQGIEDGGGVFTNAFSRQGIVEAKIRFGDKTTLTLAGARQIRSALEKAGPITGSGKLSSTRGTASLAYALSRTWSLIGAYTAYSQDSQDLAVFLPDVHTNRYFVGIAAWFGRNPEEEERRARPGDTKDEPEAEEPEEPTAPPPPQPEEGTTPSPN